MGMAVNEVNEVGHYGSDFFCSAIKDFTRVSKIRSFFLPQMQDYWWHQIKVLRRGNKSVFFSFFFSISKNLDTLLWNCLFMSSFQCFFFCSFLIYLFNLTDGKKWFGFFSHFVCLFVCSLMLSERKHGP